MTKTTPTAHSVAELEALFYGGDTYRVIPAFAAPGEVDDAERLLRHLMGAEAFFTIDGHDDGVARLRRMAERDSRCADFVGAADLLAQHGPDALLVLGWCKR